MLRLLNAHGHHVFFSSRRRHTRWTGDWSSDVCSSDLGAGPGPGGRACIPAGSPVAHDSRNGHPARRASICPCQSGATYGSWAWVMPYASSRAASASSTAPVPASRVWAARSVRARCSASVYAASHSSPVGRPRRSRLMSLPKRAVLPPLASPSVASPAAETAPRCMSSVETSTLRPGAASSSWSAVGSRPSGHRHRATRQDSSHGAAGSAAACTRTACRQSARLAQSSPSTPSGNQAAWLRCRCTSTNPGSTWQPLRSRRSSMGDGRAAARSLASPTAVIRSSSTRTQPAWGLQAAPDQIVPPVKSRRRTLGSPRVSRLLAMIFTPTAGPKQTAAQPPLPEVIARCMSTTSTGRTSERTSVHLAHVPDHRPEVDEGHRHAVVRAGGGGSVGALTELVGAHRDVLTERAGDGARGGSDGQHGGGNGGDAEVAQATHRVLLFFLLSRSRIDGRYEVAVRRRDLLISHWRRVTSHCRPEKVSPRSPGSTASHVHDT